MNWILVLYLAIGFVSGLVGGVSLAYWRASKGEFTYDGEHYTVTRTIGEPKS
jgi:hypothetical protein